MKTICTLLLTCIFSVALAHNTTYEKLVEVNKCWKDQKDIDQNQLPAYNPISGKEWIRLHLSLVEQKLRERSNEALTAAQKQNRAHRLDDLHNYWQAGNFPVNEDYSYRTPIFIDKHNNFCAVGYLIKASGNEQLSRMISANTNLAYVHDMKYPELKAWADKNGFTVDELAWIQPGYPPKVYTTSIGGGVDSEVNELFTDTIADRLYVGGTFINADKTISCNNIAYVTQTGDIYHWHSLGTGVNGTVNSIIRYGSNIFAAGSFAMAGTIPVNNVAYWDDTVWHSAGCIDGIVNSLIVFGSDLYAAGSFKICSGSHDVNFAKWDGTSWQEIPGLSGRINTMQVTDTTLLLGGAFSYGTDTPNAIRWNNASGFMPFANHIDNEVKDFELYGDTVYAACSYTDTPHVPNLLLKLQSDSWNAVFDSAYMHWFYAPVAFNTLCPDSNSLNIGGNFSYSPGIGTYAHDCFNIAAPAFKGTNNWFTVDDAINKMVMFHNELFAGGRFENGIVKRYYPPLAVNGLKKANVFNVYPNPVNSAATLTIENSFNASHFAIYDVNAKLIASGIPGNKPGQQITIPSVPAGPYLIELSNDNGDHAVKEIMVRK